jgi:nucleotide-binding universal stress UspA family protein
MTDSIVCGLDISESARPVVDTAKWLANGIDGRLVVVHVAQEPDLEAEEFASTVRNRLGAGKHDVRVAQGSPAEALLQAAEDEHAEFLIVGSRGQRALRAGLFGSVSSEVASRAVKPIVVVPPSLSEASYEKAPSIVCGVDGSDHALIAARVADRLARDLGCRLLIVHALHDMKATASYLGARATNPPLSAQSDARQAQAARIVADAVDLLGGDATGIVEPGAPWNVLESVAGAQAGRLLVVAARGRGAVRKALFGSVAARLATTASRPVVMVPEPTEPL